MTLNSLLSVYNQGFISYKMIRIKQVNKWLCFQFASFQVIWLICVLGGNHFLWAPILLILIHLKFSPTQKQDLWVLPLAGLGFVIDIFLSKAGVYSFSSIPYWLLILWLAFILNFGHSLRYLNKTPLAAISLIGAIAGAWSYLAAWKLGAVALPLGMSVSAFIVMLEWAILLPILVKADNFIRQE